MAKKPKVKVQEKAPLTAAVASIAAELVAAVVPAKMTKRNSTPTTAMLVATDKVAKPRAGHTKAAWEAVIARLPATAAELAKLEPLQAPGCVSALAFVSYMQRRGFLAVKS